MRFSGLVNATVRFGAVFKCREPYGAVRLYLCKTVRFGAVFQYYRKTYGAVRFGLEEGQNIFFNIFDINFTNAYFSVICFLACQCGGSNICYD